MLFHILISILINHSLPRWYNTYRCYTSFCSWADWFESYLVTYSTHEPPRDKTNKMTVRTAKTQISLGIRPVWSESSLCAQWVAKAPSFLHADSEDSDQTGRMPRLIWVFAGRTTTLLVLSWGGRAPAAQRQMRQMRKKISFGPTFFHLAQTFCAYFFRRHFYFFFVISGMNCASG